MVVPSWAIYMHVESPAQSDLEMALPALPILPVLLHCIPSLAGIMDHEDAEQKHRRKPRDSCSRDIQRKSKQHTQWREAWSHGEKEIYP